MITAGSTKSILIRSDSASEVRIVLVDERISGRVRTIILNRLHVKPNMQTKVEMMPW